jgi:hypothetical protein
MNWKLHDKKSFIPLFLGLLFTILLVNLLIQAWSFIRNILQMDFATFYTAGESLNAGVSPYLNQITHSPPIWDGINRFIFSRFQYPPPAAMLFQPLAALPYLTAKYLWVIGTLFCLLFSMFLTMRFFPLSTPWQRLTVGILFCGFFPLYTQLERGQIDGVTLFLLMTAIILMLKNDRRLGVLAGLSIALAILLKLYCVFLLPFLFLRRRWSVLTGVLCGIILLVVGSFLMPEGRLAWQEYTRDVLPRISVHDESIDQQRINYQLIKDLIGTAGQDTTIKDGRSYQLYGFNFSSNASLMRVILDESFPAEAKVNRSLISLIVFLGLSFLFLLWQKRIHELRTSDQRMEFLYWYLILMIILLAAPLTWTMNTVWLLPTAVVFISEYHKFRDRYLALTLIFMASGFLLAALPDHKFLGLVDYFQKTWLNHKYVIAEIAILIGGIGYQAEGLKSNKSKDLKQIPR